MKRQHIDAFLVRCREEINDGRLPFDDAVALLNLAQHLWREQKDRDIEAAVADITEIRPNKI
jgi:hypothetical protein